MIAALVRSREGRASGTYVPGASSAMKRMAREAQLRVIERDRKNYTSCTNGCCNTRVCSYPYYGR